jgi:hypothetical protein
MVEESTQIHEMAERVMRAEFICTNLRSIEQSETLEKYPEVEENF